MKFFVDSNVIIESFKEKGLEEAYNMLEFIFTKNLKAYINLIVENEVIFHLIIKGKGGIKLNELDNFLSSFGFLNIEEHIRVIYKDFILKYNLKPNDALILATCKHYNIPYLLSLDEDFKEACEKESLTLIDSVEKLKRVLNKTK